MDLTARIRGRLVGILVLSVLLLSVCAVSTKAQEMVVPAEIQADLLLKVLKFSRGITTHAGQELTLAILYQPKYNQSLRTKEHMESAFRSFMPKKIGGLDLNIETIEYSGAELLERQIISDSIDIIYIAPLRAVDLAEILAVTKRLRVLTQTGVPEYVREGVSVGIGIKNNKPDVLINQRSSIAEGAEFSSQLLRIATLFDRIGQ